MRVDAMGLDTRGCFGYQGEFTCLCKLDVWFVISGEKKWLNYSKSPRLTMRFLIAKSVLGKGGYVKNIPTRLGFTGIKVVVGVPGCRVPVIH